MDKLEPPPSPNNLYFEPVIATVSLFPPLTSQIGKGIYFTQRNITIDFQCTTQDVITLLGKPDDIFFKEEDKMRIHTISYQGINQLY
jgi:hypothetical protein